jgi:hypothetical protein
MDSYFSQERTQNRHYTYPKKKHTIYRWARPRHPIESQWLASLDGRGRAIKNTTIKFDQPHTPQKTPHKLHTNTMATTLDLSNAVMHDDTTRIHDFFTHNTLFYLLTFNTNFRRFK